MEHFETRNALLAVLLRKNGVCSVHSARHLRVVEL